MDDKIIDEILPSRVHPLPLPVPVPDEVVVKRTRLSVIASGGRSLHYFEKELTVGDIEKLKCCEVLSLYAKYEAKLGDEITKSLGSTVINLYASFVGKALTILPGGDGYRYSLSREDLTRDLEKDVLISNALSGVACEMYYRFGYLLAPLSVGLTTIRHIKRKLLQVPDQEPIN